MRTLHSSWLLCIALFLAACSSNKSQELSDYSSADSAGLSVQTDTVTNLPGDAAKLVKTASMDFTVKDVKKSSRTISETARSLGGLVTHQTINSSLQNSKSIPLSNDSMLVVSSYQTNAEMYVRVPAANMEDFIHRTADLAVSITKSNLDIEDRSIDYLSSELKQQSRQKIINSQTAKPVLKTKDALTLADQNDQIIGQKLDNLRTDANVKYSIVQLSFSQTECIRQEKTASNDLDTYNAPFYKRFSDAAYTGLIVFEDIIVGVTRLWAFMLSGLAGWIAYRSYQKKIKIRVPHVRAQG